MRHKRNQLLKYHQSSCGAFRNQSSHTTARKNEGNATHASSQRSTKSSSTSAGHAYDEQIVGALQRMLYATEDSPSVLAEAQAMIAQQQNQLPTFPSPIAESIEEKPKNEAQKRKDISTFEVDLEASSKSTPRQRLSDISNVHDDSPLMDY